MWDKLTQTNGRKAPLKAEKKNIQNWGGPLKTRPGSKATAGLPRVRTSVSGVTVGQNPASKIRHRYSAQQSFLPQELIEVE